MVAIKGHGRVACEAVYVGKGYRYHVAQLKPTAVDETTFRFTTRGTEGGKHTKLVATLSQVSLNPQALVGHLVSINGQAVSDDGQGWAAWCCINRKHTHEESPRLFFREHSNKEFGRDMSCDAVD